MASCRCILKKLVRDGRITVAEYEKLLRNLKPQITKEDAIDYLHQIRWMQTHDKEIWRDGYNCGKNERKTGKWVADGCRDICSECGASRENQLWDDYCGRCGAKMEVEE